MEWRSIKLDPPAHGSAGDPKTYVMLSKQEQGTTLVCTGYVNRHGAYEWFGGGMMGLTHWMPLPSPPNTGDAA